MLLILFVYEKQYLRVLTIDYCYKIITVTNNNLCIHVTKGALEVKVININCIIRLSRGRNRNFQMVVSSANEGICKN